MSVVPHAALCTSVPGCLRLETPAVLSSKLDSIHSRTLRGWCSPAQVSYPVGISKALLASRVVKRAEEVVSTIYDVDCAVAQRLFNDQMGRLAALVLRTVDEDLAVIRVPWWTEPVRVTVLKACLDRFTIPALREFAAKFETDERTSAYRKDRLLGHLVACLELTLDRGRRFNHLQLRDALLDEYEHDIPQNMSYDDTLICWLQTRIPLELLAAFMTATDADSLRTDERTWLAAIEVQKRRLRLLRDLLFDARLRSSWPRPIHRMLKISAMSDFYKATALSVPLPCAACARRRVGHEVSQYRSDACDRLRIESLRCSGKDAWLAARAEELFVYPEDRSLDGLVLSRDGLDFRSGYTLVNICLDCELPMRRGSVPKFALANGLYRGELPQHLRDLTWVEEQVCALYVGSTNVSRLFGSNDPTHPFVFYGNTCAHPQNVVQTMSVLPRTVGHVADTLAVIFVGPGKYKPKVFEKTFRVRREKIMLFLRWLKTNNKLYQHVAIDESLLAQYPEDGPLPGIETRVVHDETSEPEARLAEETAAFEDHPSEHLRGLGPDDQFVFMEALGVTDSSSNEIPACTFDGAALINLLPTSFRPPDITLHRGSKPVGEYNNEDYFPGLFPTLFPLGIGGLEDRRAQVHPVAFQTHAGYLLDLHDRCFARHRSFMFMVVNIIQRRKVHLETRFRVKSSRVAEVEHELASVTAAQIRQLGLHLSSKGSASGAPPECANVFRLLKLVESISAKVPGSPGTKVALRRDMYTFIRHFGIPHVFLTLNPSPVHNPLFQVVFGDETVDLSERYPKVLDAVTRSLRVAQDPAAAADFFDLTIRLIFEHLLGWDFERNRSSERGGILGHIEFFAGSVEMTNRHIPHVHYIIRLRGGLNPAEFHTRMDRDSDFQDRFFAMFESMIRHHLPQVQYTPEPDVNPRQQRPPAPPDFTSDLIPNERGFVQRDATPGETEELEEWDAEFESEVKILGEAVQRHRHKPVCRAYGYQGECRFLFPHEIVERSSYDSESKSVIMQCLEGDVNYFNPEILVSARCNHDIKNILSGRSAQAAVCYIAGYVTKQDVNTSQVLNMMSVAAERIEAAPLPDGQTVPLSTLIHKCLAQFSHNQQLHAQRAVRYIRGLNDYFLSHELVPITVGLLMHHVKATYALLDVENHNDAPLENDDVTTSNEDRQYEDRRAHIVDGDDDTDPFVQIYSDRSGNLRYSNQVEDYIYRDPRLASYHFYDFVRIFKPCRQSESSNRCFTLEPGHSRAESHCLRYRNSDGVGPDAKEFVPSFVGGTVPRKDDSAYYKLFCLALFKPFSHRMPLIPRGSSVHRVFASHEFTDDAMRRMSNWEALYECEDERDADRIKRQSRKGQKYANIPDMDDSSGPDDGFVVDPSLIPDNNYHPETFDFWSALQSAGWFSEKLGSSSSSVDRGFVEPTALLSDSIPEQAIRDNWKDWRPIMREQEAAAINLGSRGAAALTALSLSGAHTTTAQTPQPPPRNWAADPSTFLRVEPVPELTIDLAKRYAERHTLNREQSRAYYLIVRSLISRLRGDDDFKPLRLILHGPGGTGKTHCLRPLQELLDAVGMSDIVVRVAPTGTAASLIDGRTLHSALKLKIKRTRSSGDTEVIELDWNASDRKHITDIFGPAHIVILDEFSMASLKLIAQLDAGTRMAKQNFDDFFGGLSVVLSGDLCQYAPVSEKAVYAILPNTPQRDASKTSLNKMGKLAYRSFDCVIEFTEQQRMKEDPVFGAAVTRLRTRTCTHEDVALFNTRVMKSARRPDGVDMSTAEMSTACVISTTNRARVQLNASKAKSLGAHLPSYVEISAADTLKGGDKTAIDGDLRRKLLDLYLPPDYLPGRLNFYSGMPVIMRRKNISVGLKATNGAQGVLRQLISSVDKYSASVANLALIALPGSPINLPRLEPGVFPVAPQTCTFPVVVKDVSTGKDRKLTVSRAQLAVEPAFSVTGHIAQGRTLPKSVADPAAGGSGFYNYVSISRARALTDIAFVREMSLAHLNEPLPQPLRFELKRLAALAHNTAVECGDLEGDKVAVPVHDMDRILTADLRLTQSRPLKRAADAEAPPAKRARVTSNRGRKAKAPDNKGSRAAGAPRRPAMVPPAAASHTGLSAGILARGPAWDSQEWSCAYDTAFVGLYACYAQLGVAPRQCWRQGSEYARNLNASFTALLSPSGQAPLPMEAMRDSIRSLLKSRDPVSFPSGPGAQADIFQLLRLCSRSMADPLYNVAIDVDAECTSCHASVGQTVLQISSDVDSLAGQMQFSLADWLNDRLFSAAVRALPVCPPCCGRIAVNISTHNPVPILVFYVTPGLAVQPCEQFTLFSSRGSVRYQLGCVAYVSPDGPARHFACRVFSNDAAWIYDGQIAGGRLRREAIDPRVHSSLQTLDGSRACALLYYSVPY